MAEGGTAVRDKVVVVTGGASGIGRALAERFAADGARAVVIADLDAAAAVAVAAGLPLATVATGRPSGAGLGVEVDVTDENAARELVRRVEDEIGGIDIWCSNAGVGTGADLGEDGDWDTSWRVHVLAHVYAARHVLPPMLARARGHFLVTASAAGLLTNMDAAPYSVTKHGAVALAEWLAIRHGSSGVSFSCLCPQGVRTPMTAGFTADEATLAAGAMIEPEEVADCVMAALADGRFLILPHPEVAEFERRRAADRDRWLAGMRRVHARLHTA